MKKVLLGLLMISTGYIASSAYANDDMASFYINGSTHLSQVTYLPYKTSDGSRHSISCLASGTIVGAVEDTGYVYFHLNGSESDIDLINKLTHLPITITGSGATGGGHLYIYPANGNMSDYIDIEWGDFAGIFSIVSTYGTCGKIS